MTLNYQNATSPDVEAAVPVLPSSSADSLPAGSLRTFWLTWRRSLTAAGDCLHSLRDRFAAWCREVSGEIELEAVAPCDDCGRPCAKVNPDLPTAEGCAGPLFVGFCDVCLVNVEKAGHSTYHRLTRERRVPAKEFYRKPTPA
jgi:hypothetical protein